MMYIEERDKYTSKMIPEAWKKVIETEQTAELLIYKVLTKCMESFSDVTLEIPVGDPVGKVINSLVQNEENDFGKNAIYFEDKGTKGYILGCKFDAYKLRDDLEVFKTDLFGTISNEEVVDIIDANSEVSEEKIKSYDTKMKVLGRVINEELN